MRKSVKIFIVLGISASFLIVAIPITLILLSNQTTSNNLPRINIYVNSAIYNSISSDVQQYQQDVIAQNYSVGVISWSNTDVEVLRQHLKSAYLQGLVGAILIGELPYKLGRFYDSDYSMDRYFPCDLYLMDFDGEWDDKDDDQILDLDPGSSFEHGNGTGDWTPEIWIARISPHSIIETGFNYINAYHDYFDRCFNLRHNNTYRPHKALLYIDDTWSSYKAEWESNFTAYTGANLSCYANDPSTNSNNYMSNITNVNYEFVHLLCHSWPTYHLFGPSGSEGTITYNDIFGNVTKPLFYNLYACYACNFTQDNNIGTHYLFSNNTITVIGSSRSGGLDLYQPFYDALLQGKNIGESFQLWFKNPEIVKYNKEHLYYGMTILGDPLATIHMT